jgi:Domain of unknown function (DUF4402)
MARSAMSFRMTWGLSVRSLMLQRFRRALCTALSCALLAGLASPALAETAINTGTVGAVVVEPNSLVKVDDMDFALVAPRATAGSVVLNAATNACSSPDGMIRMGTCQAATFAGMGRRNFFVRIQYPTTITLTGPGQAMTVDTVTLDTTNDLVFQPTGNGNGNGNRRYRIASPTGIFTFRMGGTLRVNANQAAGVYAGTYSVTTVYN